jgi:molecular chaperone DnaK
VGGMTRMPRVITTVKDFFKKDPHRGVNPDEVVAIGAGIQGAVLTGQVKDVLLLDVTPLSLGIETLGGVTTRIIERNTTIPTKKSQVFSTASDNQTAVSIHVTQGEREMAADNKTLGRFELVGIPPAPRGVPQIEVTFDIDANGIVHVTAKDLGTGREQSIKITASSGMSKEEIEKAVKESEAHAAEDKKKREVAEARNEADTLIYSVEKSVADYGSKLTDAERTDIQKALEEAKRVKDGQDIEAIKKAVADLSKASHKLAEEIYSKMGKEQAQPGAGAGAAGGDGKKPEEKVVDAEFEEVDKDKK